MGDKTVFTVYDAFIQKVRVETKEIKITKTLHCIVFLSIPKHGFS